MNFEDYAKINKIIGRYSVQMPGIKIIDDRPVSVVCEKFKKDLDLFNSLGGYNAVSRVKICGECFVEIQLKDNGTPLIYYFATSFNDVKNTIEEFKSICEELNIRVDYLENI